MPITITVTDGTVTANPIVIPDDRAGITADALSAAVGDTTPPANDARAIRQAIAAWVGDTRRRHRQNVVRRTSEAALASTIAAIDTDETAARP